MDKPENLKSTPSHGEVEELLLESDNKIKTRNMTLLEKIQLVKSYITVEPVLGLFSISSVLSMFAMQNLNLDKACSVNLAFSESICLDLKLMKNDNHTFEEIEVQKLVASVQAWKSIANTVGPLLLMLFIGAWSDKTGKRKICMLMPILGEFMTCLLNITNTYFFYHTSVEWTAFMEVVLLSITGGWYTIYLGAFSYMGDITSKDTRTFRLGILNLFLTLGIPVGMGLSGVLLRYLGYYGVFALSGTLQFINFCYVLFAIKDCARREGVGEATKTVSSQDMVAFFDIQSLKDTVQVAFKKGPQDRRLRICLILIVTCLMVGPANGETSIIYIFFRYRFNWDEIKISLFCTYSLVSQSLGLLIAVSLISRRLRADDATLGMISTVSKICGASVMAFARSDYVVYLSPLLDMLSGTSTVALKSIASKLVSSQEFGKLYALLSIVETVTPLIFPMLYSWVYIATLEVLPGAVFLLTVFITLLTLGTFGWFYQQHLKDAKKTRLNAVTVHSVQTDLTTVLSSQM